MEFTSLLPHLVGKERAARAEDLAIQEALKKWKDATRFFESVSDPELMDYAIYDMEAARRKYMFLLHRKAQGKQIGRA